MNALMSSSWDALRDMAGTPPLRQAPPPKYLNCVLWGKSPYYGHSEYYFGVSVFPIIHNTIIRNASLRIIHHATIYCEQLGFLDFLQFTQFILFIMEFVIYWGAQEIHDLTQFIARHSLGRQHIPTIPQFIVLYLLCQDLLWLLGILNSI